MLCNYCIHLTRWAITALTGEHRKSDYRLGLPGMRQPRVAGHATVMRTIDSVGSRVRCISRLAVLLPVFGLASGNSGCSLIGASVAHMHEAARDRKTRGDVRSLDRVEPGAPVIIKQRDTLAVTGRFQGFSRLLAIPTESPDSSSHEAVLLRTGWQSHSIPSTRVEWVEMKSSPHVVLIGFGIGLVVDATIIYIIGRAFSGMGGLGD